MVVYFSYFSSLLICVIFQELLLLEDDVKALEEMYPQGEKVMKIFLCVPLTKY